MTLPAGVYAQTYEEDQALIRTKPQWIWFVVLMLFVFTLPLFSGGRIIGIMNIIWITLRSRYGWQVSK